MIIIWIFLLFIIVTYFVLYVKRKHSYWKEKGIPFIQPKFLVGSFELIQSKSWGEKMKEYYQAYPETRYHGIYMFLNPALVIKDLDLIKQILVKDFDHFTDRRTVITNDIDPFWGRNLTNAHGEVWKNLRSTLSPTFTASKMKIMFNLIEECAERFIEYFKNDQSEVIEVEMRDVIGRYANDVIATTAFGIECNSFKDKNNDFFLMGKDITNVTPLRMARFMIFFVTPTLTRLFKIKVIPPYIAKYFSKIIEETVKTREEQNIVRPDMIQLMMEARKGHQNQEEDLKINEGFSIGRESEPVKASGKYEITMEDIIAQAFIFFFAGFDSSSTLVSFALYELALHPDIQNRLRKEINTVYGKINYEKLLKLKYLDMVVSETLRKWSPASFTDRVVTKEYTIQPEKPGEVPLTLPVGSGCLIPIWPIHKDPQYYPEPDRFDPERFNDENKHKILPFTYMPFGAGPRFCIGNRFALLEGKLLLFHVLKNFEVVPVRKTRIPMVLDPKQFGPVAKGGMWLGLKKITE